MRAFGQVARSVGKRPQGVKRIGGVGAIDLRQQQGAGALQGLLSFSKDDCTSSLGWPPFVQRTFDRERSGVLCT
ncbi:hypothetical protein, partial [Thiomonas sp. 13-64-67]|uniref:hypothetical protein n=1 Tax=Thiomonas sp. 13-64-67 TaxID=1970447 RepID=UPI00257CF4DF